MNTLSAIIFALLPYCAAEDSNNCKYDASLQGNGAGQSFFVIADHVFEVKS